MRMRPPCSRLANSPESLERLRNSRSTGPFLSRYRCCTPSTIAVEPLPRCPPGASRCLIPPSQPARFFRLRSESEPRMYRQLPIEALPLRMESDMWLRTGLFFLGLCCAAQAQIAPTGPPQNAPPAETMLPAPAKTEAEARQKLSSSGYPNVGELLRSSDGGWTGTATVNGRSFTVHVNSRGEIERRD